jgi:hypothetical protein
MMIDGRIVIYFAAQCWITGRSSATKKAEPATQTNWSGATVATT